VKLQARVWCLVFLTHSIDLCSRTDDWSHRKMCDPLGIRSAGFGRRQLPEVRRFAGSTSSGARRDTLGMSSVHDNAAASTRALSQVAFSMYWCTSAVQVGLMYHYLCMPSGQAPYLVSKNGRLAIKGCCTWLDCACTQLWLPGGLPIQQATVCVKLKMASKMAAMLIVYIDKNAHTAFFYNSLKC